MSLHNAELVVSLEEAFGIEIHEDEAAACKPTPGGVTDLVHGKISTADEEAKAVRPSFFALRDALKKLYQKPGPVRPSTDLVTYLPYSVRTKAWTFLQRELGDALPPLRRPRELWIIGLWVCPAIGFAFGMLQRDEQLQIPVGLGMTILPVIALWLLTKPFARDFPGGVARVWDLAKVLASRQGTTPHDWTRDEVATTVHGIISRQSGVLEFGDDAHLVTDLGLD